MQLKRFQIYKLFSTLKNLPQTSNIKVGYLFAKNTKLLQPVVDAIDEAKKPMEGYVKYEQERIKLCLKLADKDSDKNPVTQINASGVAEYIIKENKNEFDRELSKLQKEHATVIEEQKNRNKQLEELLNGVENIELSQVSLEELATAYKALPQETIETLFSLIVEV